MNEISRSSWLELYSLANSFQRLAPWNWMYDSDIFGVQDPDSGAIGFCSIIRREKDILGMAIYKGFKGLAGYEQMLDSIHHEYASHDLISLQEYLLISFQAPQALQPQEQAHIQKFGLHIHTEALWPSFIDYSTGYIPWPIQQESEARFLIHAMREAIFVAKEIQRDENYLEAPSDREETLLIRTPMKGDKEFLWHNRRLQVPATLPKLPHIEVNQLYLLSNCLNLPRVNTSWLLELFFFPAPSQKEEEIQTSSQEQRSYYPLVLLVVDLESGRTLRQDLFRPDELSSQLVFSFVEMVKSIGNLPNSLLVSNYQSIGYWEEIARLLKLPLELDRNNRFVDDIKGSLFGSFPQ